MINEKIIPDFFLCYFYFLHLYCRSSKQYSISIENKEAFLWVRVLDLAGKQVLYQDHFGKELTVDLSPLAPSIYLVEVKNESGLIVRRKLIKTD